jgi:hypothetical protein
MVRLLRADNFDAYFDKAIAFMASRSQMYCQDAERIRDLTRSGTPHDAAVLLRYVRPWDIDAQGDFLGREWVRLVAMQSLCFLAAGSAAVRAQVEAAVDSDPPEWSECADVPSDFWGTLSGAHLLIPPRDNFVQCIRETLDCALLP